MLVVLMVALRAAMRAALTVVMMVVLMDEMMVGMTVALMAEKTVALAMTLKTVDRDISHYTYGKMINSLIMIVN